MAYSGYLSRTSSIYRKSIDLDILDPDPPFWTKTSWLQLGYGMWVNLTLMNIGLCSEFSAVAVPQLKQDDSDIKITNTEEATIASILTLSCPIGCIAAGVVLDRCGRKAGMILCNIPIAIGWFYIGFARYASGIIFGRVISGIGIGMAMAAPRAYTSEITLPNMRGVIGALPNLSMSMGLTIQAILGTFFDWRLLCYLSGGYAMILVGVNFLLPDTPYFVLLKSSASSARMTLKRFRSSKFNLDSELKTLEEFKTLNHIRRLTLCETKRALFRSSSCKPFGIILFYISLHQLTGVNVVTAWAVEMLTLAKSSIDPHWGNVGLGVTRIVVGIATAFILFRVGRRPLALLSAAGVGGVGITLGGYLYTYEGGRTPLIMLICYVACAVPGYHTLPTLMMFELLPLQVRGILSGIIFSISNILQFVAIRMYPTCRDTIGLSNTFIMYGAISLFGTVVLYMILPETKELTLQEIEEFFNHRRSTLISERRLMSIQLRSQILSSIRSKQAIGSTQPITSPSKIKKKKHLRIVSSESVTMRYKIDNSNNTEKHNSDDMVIVYDEDEIDTDKRDNDQSGKSKKEATERHKMRRKAGKTDKENNNVISENKDKTDKEEQDIATREEITEQGVKIREETTEQKDGTEKKNAGSEGKDKTEKDTKEKENKNGDLDKPSTSGN